MARDDKTCVMCNKMYKYCENCPSKYNTSETWRNIFCSENCREMYHVYDLYKAGKTTDKSAAKSLSRLNTDYLFKLNDPMKSVLVFLASINKKPEPKSIVIDKEKEVKEVKKAKAVDKDIIDTSTKRKGRNKKDLK